MSGTLPTSPGFTATNFKINTPNQFTETFGGKIRRSGIGTSYYSFTCKYPPMTRSQAGPIIGFVAAQSGMLDSFQVFLPDQSYPTAGYTGTVTVVGTYAAGVKQVTVSAQTGSSLILRAGDYFKFTGPAWATATAYTAGQYVTQNNVDYVCTSSHTSGLILDTTKFALQTKVYLCASDVNSAAGGGATINFSGSLLQPLPDGARVNVSAVPFTVMLARDLQEYETGVGRMVNMELDMRESF
jgi:hypothetical protein